MFTVGQRVIVKKRGKPPKRGTITVEDLLGYGGKIYYMVQFDDGCVRHVYKSNLHPLPPSERVVNPIFLRTRNETKRTSTKRKVQ